MISVRAVSLAFSLGAPAFAPQPPKSVEPAAGVFLVAKRSIEGGPFHQSVVLLLSHGEQGTLGLIVNRVTDVVLSEALPDLDSEETGPHALHFGGPVGLDGLLFLFRSEKPPEKVAPVMGNVYFSGDRKILEKLLKDRTGVSRLKLYLGHAGWAPSQLDSEIARGDWELVPADPVTVFQKDPSTMWRELSRGGTVVAGLGAVLEHLPVLHHETDPP